MIDDELQKILRQYESWTGSSELLCDNPKDAVRRQTLNLECSSPKKHHTIGFQ